MPATAKKYLIRAAVVAATLLSAIAAPASELVYVPVNPAFGGSPLNGPGLLGIAQQTNKHKDKPVPLPAQPKASPLQQFTDMLERSILGQLSSAATSGVMGPGAKLQPGSVETGNFRIEIADAGGGTLVITTTDKVTGAATSFQVGGP
jgi:curli production assembly/transport component CsgF